MVIELDLEKLVLIWQNFCVPDSILTIFCCSFIFISFMAQDDLFRYIFMPLYSSSHILSADNSIAIILLLLLICWLLSPNNMYHGLVSEISFIFSTEWIDFEVSTIFCMIKNPTAVLLILGLVRTPYVVKVGLRWTIESTVKYYVLEFTRKIEVVRIRFG